MKLVNSALLTMTLMATSAFAQYGQYEFDVANTGFAACFRQKDGRSVGTSLNQDLCIKYGYRNTFEFEVSRNGYVVCYLQRKNRSVASASNSLCWKFGIHNDFLFDTSSQGYSACFLQRKGKSVGYSVPDSWCSQKKI